MPQEPDGKLILVNIPEFVLHFVDGKKPAKSGCLARHTRSKI